MEREVYVLVFMGGPLDGMQAFANTDDAMRLDGGPSGLVEGELDWPLPQHLDMSSGTYTKVSESQLPPMPGVVRGATYLYGVSDADDR